jgi:hypothetical protein
MINERKDLYTYPQFILHEAKTWCNQQQTGVTVVKYVPFDIKRKVKS